MRAHIHSLQDTVVPVCHRGLRLENYESQSVGNSHELENAHVVSPRIFRCNVQGVIILCVTPSIEIAEGASQPPTITSKVDLPLRPSYWVAGSQPYNFSSLFPSLYFTDGAQANMLTQRSVDLDDIPRPQERADEEG